MANQKIKAKMRFILFNPQCKLMLQIFFEAKRNVIPGKYRYGSHVNTQLNKLIS